MSQMIHWFHVAEGVAFMIFIGTSLFAYYLDRK